MTTIERSALRFRSALSILAGAAFAACGGSDSLGVNGTNGSLAPGQGAPVNGATTLRLDGGSTGTEDVLVVVDTSLDSTAVKTKKSYQVTTTGTGPAGNVSAPATALVPLVDGATAVARRANASRLDIGYGMRLNARSQKRFAGGFQAARSAYQAGSALPRGMSRSIAAAAPQVGDIFTVNVQTDSACTAIIKRGARVVAIGAQSIVLSDTLNPSGGFSSSDSQRFAAR